MIAHCIMRATCFLSILLSASAQSPFTLKSANVLAYYDDVNNNFGPEDKMLECNDAMVFVDLDQTWDQLCATCRGGTTPSECSPVQVPNITYSSVLVCQQQCQLNGTCNAINYATSTQDCQLLACVVNPPSFVGDPNYQFWTYNLGTALTYNPGANTWTGYDIVANACPDPDQPPAPLVPRDSGYTVGIMFDKGQGGGDRMLVLGGDQEENNVYFSDDCGRTWNCYDGENLWDPRSFAPIVHPQGIFPNDPGIILGGDIVEALPSIAIFFNYGDGTSNWVRPTCDGTSPCPYDCEAETPNGYCNPSAPIYPGQVASDWTTLWMWFDSPSPLAGQVFWLNTTNFATTGWSQLPGANSAGSFGRRVFVKGANPGSGCFFSTDFTANRLWNTAAGIPPDATSSNSFATSRSAGGPWVPGTAPWAARGSAVVVTSEAQDFIWVGGGFQFANGVPTADPLLGDLWTVDGTVCLLGANGVQCTDPTHVAGPPDIPNLLCNCLPQWQGDDRCASCTLGNWGPTCSGTCPSGNGFCNSGNGWGVCDPTNGCMCTGNHVQGPAAACDACTPGYATPDCSACAPCDPTGGYCDGDGTPTGTGQCICNPGFSGPTCSNSVPSFSRTASTTVTGTLSPSPRAAAPASASLSPGAAAAVSVVVISLALGGGLFVWGKFLGGGPKLSAAWSSVTSLGGGGYERSSLLGGARASPAPIKSSPMSQAQIASRFGSKPTKY